MTNTDSTNQILVTFAHMNRQERQVLLKLLKRARIKLDIQYPSGMPNAKNELPSQQA